MRGLFTFILAMVAIALIWGGGGNTYVALTNRQPTAMTCADYMHNGSHRQWLELSDCMVDLKNVVSLWDKTGRIEGFYAPLLPVGESNVSSPIVLRAGSRKAMQRLAFSTTFKGLAQFGLDGDSAVRSTLTSGKLGLTSDFVILEPGKEPKPQQAVTLLGIGLIAGLWCVGRIRKGGRRPQCTESDTFDAADTAPPMALPRTPERDEVADPVHQWRQTRRTVVVWRQRRGWGTGRAWT